MSDFLFPALFLVAMIVAGFSIIAVRQRRRRAARSAGRAIHFRALLGGRPPKPKRLWFGRLHVSNGVPVWYSTGWRRTDSVNLAGARVLRAEAIHGPSVRPSDAGVLVRMPDGTTMTLVVHHREVELLEEVLESSTAGTSAPPLSRGTPVPWWAALLLGLCALWAGFWIWCWTAGTVLDARVTEPASDDGWCEIDWNDPRDGKVQHAGVSCAADTPAGATIRVLALPPPLNGEAGTVGESIGIPVGFGAAVLLPTLGYLILRNRRPRRPVEAVASQVPGTDEPDMHVPDLGEGEIGYHRIAEVMRVRAKAEGWAGPAETQIAPALDERGGLGAVSRPSFLFASAPLVLAALIPPDVWEDHTRIAASIAVVVVVLVLYRISRVAAAIRGLRKVRAGESRPWRYVLFRDSGGGVGMMLFNQFDDGPPAVLVPLAIRPDTVTAPVVGSSQVHGTVGHGNQVVPVIAGRTFWPRGPAEQVPTDIVRDIVNGELPMIRGRRRPPRAP